VNAGRDSTPFYSGCVDFEAPGDQGRSVREVLRRAKVPMVLKIEKGVVSAADKR